VRRHVLDALEEAADICHAPPARGALYLLVRVPRGGDAVHLAERLIKEHKVAVIPGTAFGVDGECSLRVSYGALQPATVGEGIRRLTTGLRALVAG
jgi:aspartate/methionine/tyrosine aminotransferase